MPRSIIECVPNFSEGRDAAKVAAIEAAIARGPGIAILGRTMDPDHNRSVITFAGSPEAVVEAALRGVGKAAELIDLTSHIGVHPRIGATDVLPLVPVEGIAMDDCAALAAELGKAIWERFSVPVYLYEEAARRPDRKRLELIRRGGFEQLQHAAVEDPDRRPDIGGPRLHQTAGATVVGARPFLIAYNINLRTEDVRIAKAIARSIRTSSGGLPHVKALGLSLASRKQTQVSMNLTDFWQTPVHVVYEAVRARAESEGVRIAGSEIIGLIPKAALEMTADYFLQCENFSPDVVLENRLAEELPYSIDDVLDEISDPKRSAGGGTAAALAGAMGAALGVLTARLMKVDAGGFVAHRRFFREAADRDAQAFAALMRTGSPSPESLVEATEAPLSIAERALALHDDLSRLASECPDVYASDVSTGIGLALSAKRGAIATVAINLPRIDGSSTRDAMSARLRTLEERESGKK